MSTSRSRRWASITAVVMTLLGIQLAVQAVGQSPAMALPGLVVEDAQTPFDSNLSPKTVRAQCPAGKRVVGGGARIIGGDHLVLTRTQPIHTNNLDGYEATAFEDGVGTSALWSVQAFAVCADPLPELEIVEHTAGPGSADFQRVAAFCPDGTFALGGGGRITGGQGQVHLYNAGAPSGNANNGSQAFGREDGDFDQDWSVTAYAVCAAVDGTSVDTVAESSITDSATPKSVTAQCPSGMRVTGGGAVVSTPGNTTGHPHLGPVGIVPEVLPGGAPGVNLTATGNEHRPTSDTWRIVAHAYCAA